MSLRLRLTVMYSMILALALVSFSAVIYVVTARLSQRVMEDALATEASRIIQERKFRLDAIVVPSDSTGVPYIYFVQTRDITGQELNRTWRYTGIELPMTSDTLAMTTEGRVVFTRVKIGDLSLLVFNGPIYDKPTGVLYLRPGKANGTWGTPISLGAGWNSMLVTGVGDLTGDSRPDLVADMAAAIPNATFVQAEGASHPVHHEQPEWLTKTVVDWLRERS